MLAVFTVLALFYWSCGTKYSREKQIKIVYSATGIKSRTAATFLQYYSFTRGLRANSETPWYLHISRKSWFWMNWLHFLSLCNTFCWSLSPLSLCLLGDLLIPGGFSQQVISSNSFPCYNCPPTPPVCESEVNLLGGPTWKFLALYTVRLVKLRSP